MSRRSGAEHRKIISRPADVKGRQRDKIVNAKKSSKTGSLGIRPSADVRAKLKAAADATGRSINKEAEARLAASFGEGESDIDRVLYGWTDEALRRNRALGRCAGALAYRQERLVGEPSPIVLAMLRVAFDSFMEQLGAADDALTGDHRVMAKATGRQLFNDLCAARDAGAAARELIADSAAFAAVADGLGEYAPKSSRPVAPRLARQARKKGGA